MSCVVGEPPIIIFHYNINQLFFRQAVEFWDSFNQAQRLLIDAIDVASIDALQARPPTPRKLAHDTYTHMCRTCCRWQAAVHAANRFNRHTVASAYAEQLLSSLVAADAALTDALQVVMAYIVMAYIVVAYIVMAYVVMAYI